MFEVLEKLKFIHLYFDLDNIINEEQLLSTLDNLESYKSVFGRYVYSGYSLDKNIAEKYKLRNFDVSKNDINDVHKIPIHLVYPDSRISAEDLMKIMKYKDKLFVNDDFNDLFDPNVYELSSHQLFRHVLSNMIYKTSNEKNRYYAGYIVVGSKPSEFIISVRGDEKMINETYWGKLFKINANENVEFDSKLNAKCGCNEAECKAVIDNSAEDKNEDIDFASAFIEVKSQTNHIPITKDIFDSHIKGVNKELTYLWLYGSGG